jgi:predicted ATPase/DNA-binding CsgD family transcriptional regulator
LLTRREREVLALLADSTLSNAEIAKRLFLTIHSIKWYARQIYAKLDVASRKDAVTQAHELGLLGSRNASHRAAPEAPPAARFKLPVELTSFIGRKAEIEQLMSLLTDPGVRLVTIAGPGGVGKTRLALKLAEILSTGSKASQPPAWLDPTEIALVELAGVSEAGRVLERLSAIFGLNPIQGPANLETLAYQLSARQALLVLDNCEHLIEFSAQMAAALLKACPKLRILITSREVLDIPGEHIFWVAPLSIIANPDGLPPEQANQYEAIRLFVERAGVAVPGFGLTAENIRAVAQICRQLDGLPLAIELAAAQVRMMSPEQIAERLNSSLNVLNGSSRARLPQHKTLRASIEWSFSLLSPAEQRLLVRVAVFGNEWSLETAEAVCADAESDDPLLPGNAVLQTLCGLVDKSLVTRIPYVKGQIRFRLLTSIGQFAREQLVELGQLNLMRRFYLAYLLEVPASHAGLVHLVDHLSEVNSNWDPVFLHHSERGMRISVLLAEKAGIKDEALLRYKRGAVLHDIGKLLIPEEIMAKTTQLTSEDWAVMKRHTLDSMCLLEPVPGFAALLDLDILVNHHETWDGSGYPRGLKGEEIPLAARVFAIEDVWEALSSDRPYRSAWSDEKVLNTIRSQSGKQFDPALVPLFVELVEKIFSSAA